MQLPLNALRAFEMSARHLSFTRAAVALNVSQTAVSQHVKNLEERLGVVLFRRLPRGLALTDEGAAMLPVLTDAFERIATMLEQCKNKHSREVLSVGAVGTFATGWLLPRLRAFQSRHPFVDFRLFTNNNNVDLAGEGLDYAIRFGNGAWHGTHAEPLLDAPLSPMCAPEVAARLTAASDLAREALLRSYRADEWPLWFEAAKVPCPVVHGAVFDSSLALAQAAAQGAGVALLPARLFQRELRRAELVQPFDLSIVCGSYWLTRLHSRSETPAMLAFKNWLHDATHA